MKRKLYSLFLTALLGMWGMNAWAQTTYEISTADELLAFAEAVNNGEASANAVLTADIDLAGAAWTPIGNAEVQYAGTFDGQGHAITGFEYEAIGDYNGLFGYINNATVKNFSISGTLTSNGFTKNGVVGNACGSSVVSGIYSSLTINVSNCKAHTGGIVGGDNGNTTDLVIVEGCEYSGTMTHSGEGDCQAGILGYTGYAGVRNCIFSGTIIGEGATKYGGILGYCKRPEFVGVQNCLCIGKIVAEAPQYAAAIIANWNGDATQNVKNNFYCMQEGSSENVVAIGNKASSCEAPHVVTAAQLASGEVCYQLNGSQSENVAFYQTLPGDVRPTVDATHGIVYMNGRLHCNGDIYEGATYTNENIDVIQDEHDFVDGFCSYCSLFDENYLTPNADGFIEIATAKQLAWFEQLVNKGAFETNAVLTADIDFADLMPEGAEPEETEVAWTPIGDWGQKRGISSACYKGHFDGQGHKILNFNVTSTCNYYGIFGVVSTGSFIENFTIYGTLNLGHKTGGVVAYTRDTSCTIRNIHSFITLNVTEAETTAERPGGIVGSAVNGTTIIENCTYSGILNAGGHTGNIGGIVGYINNNAAAIVNITNCLFDGEIQNGTSADGQCGGIVGYNNGGKATIKNCLSIGEIVSSTGNIGQFIGRLNGSNTTYANNYYRGDFVNGTSSGKTAKGDAPVQVSNSELSSGEIAWKLNGETFLNPTWRQNIDEDEYPGVQAEGGIVYQTSSGYASFDPNDPESIAPFIDGVIANELAFVEDDFVACQALIDEYTQTIQSWEDIDNYEDFLAAYEAAAELKESIKKSIASYLAYVQACESAVSYIEDNNLEGSWTDFLKTYLQETVEPGSDYPNGSYEYIMDTRELDDEAIAAEIAFVNQMLENAIAGGITSGTEITRLLANANFTNGFEGWTTEYEDGSITTGSQEGFMTVARGLSNSSLNIFQNLTEMPNGIYMVAANGLFRSGADINSRFYAGQLYLNGTANYIMSISEGVIPEEDAKPGVNCLGEGGDAEYTDEDTFGWVPKSIGGCSVAFSAERYQNFCATEVTDGNLTVGVRSLGACVTNDWLPFGGLHVYYLGTADEANGWLTEVLQGFAQRAQVIVDSYVSEDASDFKSFPSVYVGLIEQLEELLAEVDAATSGNEKMELIGRFSALFGEVHACRRAYIEMLDLAYKMQDNIEALVSAELIEEDIFEEWSEKVLDAQEHYINGDLTTEEVLAIVQDFKSANLISVPMSEDGVYQLSTADHVKTFSVLVNVGNTAANAVLAADIDMSEAEGFEPIGSSSNPYAGVFDGQGHIITNFGQYIEEEGEGYYTMIFSDNCQGFFGSVNGATIKNFSIEGAVEVTSGKYIGAIGQAVSSTISNVHSSLDIAVTASGVHHTGGVVGSTEGGSNTTVRDCSYAGTMTVAAGSTDNFAGVIGYLGGDNIVNCANYGTITFADAGCAAGGVAGYLNNTTTYIQNCLNVGTIQCTVSDSPKYGGAIVGRIKNNWSAERVVNNYWLEGSAYGPARKDDGSSPAAASANGSTANQLASGEVCYALNGSQEEINWFQTLGEDEYPVLDDAHKVVYKIQDGTYSNEYINTPDGSEENPFIVQTAADLSNLINQLVSGRMNYVVMEADVDMAGVTDWTPLFNIADQSNGYPYIDFDGKGHVISNLTSNTTGDYDYCGLFGVLCGNVRNLGLKDANVTCAGGTGIIAGYLGHSTYGKPCYVENVWVTGKLTANGYCGGLIGNVANESHITNCYANVEVTGSGDLTGGIIGRVRAKVEMNNVYAAGSINRGGGIIGGGFQDATPLGAYKNVAVWNNTENNFGPVREGEELASIIFYDGTNFADMQSQVVAWDPEVWYCDMQPGSYPVLKAFVSNTGDLNGDGTVDIADAVTVLDLMATSAYDVAADLNNDGVVDIADFVSVLDIMAGN